MQRGLVAEHRLEVGGIHRRDRGRVEVLDAEPLLEQERRAERPLHRDLLVEQHPEHQRERLLRREQAVGLGISREIKGCGLLAHGS